MKQERINKKIAFLGGGKMAEALISGFIKGGLISPASITASDIDAKRRAHLKKKYGVRIVPDAVSAVERADVVILAVKPQQLEGLLSEVGSFVGAKALVVSIAAGITTGWIEKFLKTGTPVIRTMPNTPAMLGRGATGIAKGSSAKDSHVALAKRLFATVGKTGVFPEDLIDSVTAVSGSGPAYVFYVSEILKEAAVELGLDDRAADDFARQTILGAGEMLFRFRDVPASELRRNVTSPGGTTEAALKSLEEQGFKEILKSAVKRARDRARELSR